MHLLKCNITISAMFVMYCLFLTTSTSCIYSQVIAQSGSNFSPSLHSITGEQATRWPCTSSHWSGMGWRQPSPWAVSSETALHVYRARTLRREYPNGCKVSRLARLNAAIGVNLKPNEDGDYADDPFMPMSAMEALRSGEYAQVCFLVQGFHFLPWLGAVSGGD